MLQVDASNNAMHLSRRLMIFLELPGSLRPGDGKRWKDDLANLNEA
jgi:hypothetical protein